MEAKAKTTSGKRTGGVVITVLIVVLTAISLGTWIKHNDKQTFENYFGAYPETAKMRTNARPVVVEKLVALRLDLELLEEKARELREHLSKKPNSTEDTLSYIAAMEKYDTAVDEKKKAKKIFSSACSSAIDADLKTEAAASGCRPEP